MINVSLRCNVGGSAHSIELSCRSCPAPPNPQLGVCARISPARYQPGRRRHRGPLQARSGAGVLRRPQGLPAAAPSGRAGRQVPISALRRALPSMDARDPPWRLRRVRPRPDRGREKPAKNLAKTHLSTRLFPVARIARDRRPERRSGSRQDPWQRENPKKPSQNTSARAPNLRLARRLAPGSFDRAENARSSRR
jgi:hypothetical protein